MTSIFKESRPPNSTTEIRQVGVKPDTIRIAGSQYDTTEKFTSRFAPNDINSCHGTRKDGGSCAAYPMKGADRCYFHKTHA